MTYCCVFNRFEGITPNPVLVSKTPCRMLKKNKRTSEDQLYFFLWAQKMLDPKQAYMCSYGQSVARELVISKQLNANGQYSVVGALPCLIKIDKQVHNLKINLSKHVCHDSHGM
jgi:hypothetical protein